MPDDALLVAKAAISFDDFVKAFERYDPDSLEDDVHLKGYGLYAKYLYENEGWSIEGDYINYWFRFAGSFYLLLTSLLMTVITYMHLAHTNFHDSEGFYCQEMMMAWWS